MIEPFERGKAWFMYSRLERDFIDSTSYVALEPTHRNVWSERFGELLIRIGGSVDSFFRFMVNSQSLNNEETVKKLREKIQRKRQKNSEWSPNITEFRKTFNSIFQLSSVDVEADYGLTYYGKLRPFKEFEKESPVWWESYNKVKHEIFREIEKATLENTINALAGLFVLNILHKESQRYVVRYTNVIRLIGEFSSTSFREKILSKSMIGVPKNVRYKLVATTPLFTHVFRVDENTIM